jgi:drug/metabolite transporter (DMT)-like permease
MRLALLATMAIWGGNLAVVKRLLERFDPMALSALRMTASAVALLLVLYWHGPGWPRLSRRQFAGMLVCGLLMVYVNQVCFTLGVQRTVAANAALVIALNPLVSSLAAAALLGDRLTPARLLGVVLGFSGVAAVVLHRPGVALGEGGLGDLLVFASVLTWVAGGLLVQWLARQMDTAVVSAVVNTLGTSAVVLHVLLDPGTRLPVWHEVPAVDWLLVVLSGLLATAVGALVWNRALSTIGVARTALYAYWVPIFGVGFAVLLLGEPLTVWHGIGLAAVLSGTRLGTRRS